jgi:uncharacterized protein (TIGR02466 family)
LLARPLGPIAEFERLVRLAVARYRDGLISKSDHPFVGNMPAKWRLNMWANVLEAEGYQVPHIHPSGWLSAVYYVSVPQIVKSDAVGRAGWIEFGEHYQDITTTAPPCLHAIQPEAGLLLMFPSYFYHRTVPYRSEEQRISISFDVVPV